MTNRKFKFILVTAFAAIIPHLVYASAPSHVSNWVQNELLGDEGSRVGVFAGCETIDESVACGESPMWEHTLIVEGATTAEQGRARITLTVNVIGEFAKPTGHLAPREFTARHARLSYSLSRVRHPAGDRLAGTPPRFIEICAAIAILRAELASLSPSAYWAAKIKGKDSEELSVLMGLEAAKACSKATSSDAVESSSNRLSSATAPASVSNYS
jgi:hypothetical protein